MFSNHFPGLFTQELRSHNLTALEDYVGPFVENSNGFNKIITSGDKFQWVLVPSKDGKPTLFISKRTTHAVCASNQDVISAGEGFFRDLKLYLNNQTGHYRASFESVENSLHHWRSLNVKFSEVIGEDFLKEFREHRKYAEQAQDRNNKEHDMGFKMDLAF
jgi:hypothetical protein